jgi:hypothetical protein
MWSTFWFIMLLVLCFTYQSDDLGNATFFQYKEKNWAWMLSIYCIYVGQPCWNDQENYMIDMVDSFIHFLASYCTRWYCFSVIFSCTWLNNAIPAYLNDSIASLLSVDFVSQEHGVPCDGPKDSNAGGWTWEILDRNETRWRKPRVVERTTNCRERRRALPRFTALVVR